MSEPESHDDKMAALGVRFDSASARVDAVLDRAATLRRMTAVVQYVETLADTLESMPDTEAQS